MAKVTAAIGDIVKVTDQYHGHSFPIGSLIRRIEGEHDVSAWRGKVHYFVLAEDPQVHPFWLAPTEYEFVEVASDDEEWS